MIDNSFQIKKEEAKQYPPLPKNIYQVELLSVDLRDATGSYAQPGEQNLSFQFTLLDGTDKGESLRGRNVWNNFGKTTLFVGKHGKNSTWQIIEAFLGKELTREEEMAGVTGKLLNSFIGKQIKVFVDHKPGKDGKIYDNIISYMPAEKQLKPLTDEEKDKATVKNKKESHSLSDLPDEPEETIDVKDIPF